MKRIVPIFLLTTSLLAESISLDNQTEYPTKQSKMTVQWANSAREVDEDNKALMYGEPLNRNTLQEVSQRGKIKLTIPKKAQHFRVLVWSQNGKEPDFTTNWINITPNKIYTLGNDYLIPVILIPGSGC